MLEQHYTMPEATSTNITGSGFKRLRRYAQTLMWYHVCLRCGCQTHRSNIPANTPSEYYCCTVSIPLLDQKWIHVSALTSKQHCLGCLLYHRSCYLSLEKSALLNSISLLKFIRMIFHLQIALKVNFIVGQ